MRCSLRRSATGYFASSMNSWISICCPAAILFAPTSLIRQGFGFSIRWRKILACKETLASSVYAACTTAGWFKGCLNVSQHDHGNDDGITQEHRPTTSERGGRAIFRSLAPASCSPRDGRTVPASTHRGGCVSRCFTLLCLVGGWGIRE